MPCKAEKTPDVTSRPGASRSGASRSGADALHALAIFMATFLIYWGSAALAGRTDTPPKAYFDQLADAFLHGRLDLVAPSATIDLIQRGGRWFVPFPPLPALLLLPWTAIAGVARVNTVVFAAAMGALNVALMYLLIRALAARGWSRLGRDGALWLTLLFGLGSVHWFGATLGSVWYVSQTCTVTFLVLAAWLAVARGSALAAGCALALAMLGRPHVALCLPLLLGIAAQGRAGSWKRWGMRATVPMIVSLAALMAYNVARFGNAFDFGYRGAEVHPTLVQNLATYGQFNLRYVPQNLWTMLLAMPVWVPEIGALLPNPEGMSLLVTTPALIYLVRARQKMPLVAGAWAAIGLLLVPLLTYYNTGWVQFGYRFSLDFMTPIMVLLAIGAGPRIPLPMRVLIVIGVAVNAWGVWWSGLGPR